MKLIKQSVFIAVIMGIVCFSISSPVVSQDIKGGRGFFMFGKHTIDLDDMNAMFNNSGYTPLKDEFITFGGGGFGIINRIVIGGEGHGLIGKKQLQGPNRSYTYGGYGLFRLGYIVYSKGGFNLYPMFGIGGGGMELRITERTVPTFGDILNDPGRGIDLHSGMLLVDVSIGLDYLINLSKNGRKEGGLAVGMRFGYTYAPYVSDLKFHETVITGSPELGISGLYVRFLIGGGGSYR